MHILKSKIAIAFLLLMSTSVAHAATKDEVHRFYFSDASRTEIVGEEMFTCGGLLVLDGERTNFFSEVRVECGEYKGFCYYYPDFC